jgi:signal transduction histidine kinase
LASLAQRFTLVITLAAALPFLVAFVPVLWRSGAGTPTAVLLVIGWALVVVGVVGAAAWVVTRALLRPLVELIDMLNPATFSEPRIRKDAPQGLPLEVRLLRAVVFGRDNARRRQAEERATYVTTLIHDMKTPLLAVSRSLDLALADADDARRTARIQATNDEVRRLLALVQDVVDAERLASGALRVRCDTVDLLELARRVAQRLERVRTAVSIRVTGRPTQPHRGDPQLLERAIENVVANAVHHARSRVDLEVMPGMVRVADDGPGLTTDFDNAGLGDHTRRDATSEAPSGRRSSGLGLFIAKRVAEAHGGRIVLESTGELGTTLLLYVGSPQGVEAAA